MDEAMASAGPMRVGDTYYVISCRWWNMWKVRLSLSNIFFLFFSVCVFFRFIKSIQDWTASEEGKGRGQSPPPIDNWCLVVKKKNDSEHMSWYRLKPDLVKDDDFVTLPSQVRD